MNLKHLTDECLLADTARLVKQERELLTTILYHFQEIERRRLFGTHGSLYNYARTVWHYSDDAACRRIAAMRLLRELPEIEKQIDDGQINLTQMGLAQTLFRNEKKHGSPMSSGKKMEVLRAMAGRKNRENHGVIQSFSSQPIKPADSIRSLGNGSNLVKSEFTDEALRQIERLRGLLAHKFPDLTIGRLVSHACAIALEKLDPAKRPMRESKKISKAEIRRRIWARDAGACTICGSHHSIQEDHVTPVALGGEYTLANMRLVCRTCNQREAIDKLGLDKMDQYLQ